MRHRTTAAQTAATLAAEKAAGRRQLASLMHILFAAVVTFFASGYFAFSLFQLSIEYSLIVAILTTAFITIIEGYLLSNIILPPEPKSTSS